MEQSKEVLESSQAMNTLEQMTGTPGIKMGKFRPYAHHNEGMDWLLYRSEDVAHRAERVDKFLTLLWHPQEDRIIGFQLTGLRWRLKDKENPDLVIRQLCECLEQEKTSSVPDQEEIDDVIGQSVATKAALAELDRQISDLSLRYYRLGFKRGRRFEELMSGAPGEMPELPDRI